MLTINTRQSEANPQSFNRYSYVQNDPVNFTDPSGLVRDEKDVYKGIREEMTVVVPMNDVFAGMWGWGAGIGGGSGGGSIGGSISDGGGGGFTPIAVGEASPPNTGQDHRELRDDFYDFLKTMSQDCKDALKDFLPTLRKLAYGASLYDVNKLGRNKASDYLGRDIGGTSSLGQVFDTLGFAAFAATDVPRSGIYFRSTSTFSGVGGMYLLLHEMTHLAYPVGIEGSLDRGLADRLGISKGANETWSRAVSRFFNSGCRQKGP